MTFLMQNPLIPAGTTVRVITILLKVTLKILQLINMTLDPSVSDSPCIVLIFFNNEVVSPELLLCVPQCADFI